MIGEDLYQLLGWCSAMGFFLGGGNEGFPAVCDLQESMLDGQSIIVTTQTSSYS